MGRSRQEPRLPPGEGELGCWDRCRAVHRNASGEWIFEGTRVRVTRLFELLDGGSNLREFCRNCDVPPSVVGEVIGHLLNTLETPKQRLNRRLFDFGFSPTLERALKRAGAWTFSLRKFCQKFTYPVLRRTRGFSCTGISELVSITTGVAHIQDIRQWLGSLPDHSPKKVRSASRRCCRGSSP